MFRDPIPQLSDKFHAIARDYVAMPPGVREFEYTLDNLAAHVEDVFAIGIQVEPQSVSVRCCASDSGSR